MEEAETKEHVSEHALTLLNKRDLKRICEILTHYSEIMNLLNDDSKNSPNGGACMHYEVTLTLKEVWM